MTDLADKVGAAIGEELIRQELAGEDLDATESNRLLGQVALEAMGAGQTGQGGTVTFVPPVDRTTYVVVSGNGTSGGGGKHDDRL